MKILLEALFLFPARVTASTKRRFNERRKWRLEGKRRSLESLLKAGIIIKGGQGDMDDLEKLSKEVLEIESGHVDNAFLEDFISNNPGIKELDLSGCTNLGEW